MGLTLRGQRRRVGVFADAAAPLENRKHGDQTGEHASRRLFSLATTDNKAREGPGAGIKVMSAVRWSHGDEATARRLTAGACACIAVERHTWAFEGLYPRRTSSSNSKSLGR